jgi:hypothetical protein
MFYFRTFTLLLLTGYLTAQAAIHPSEPDSYAYQRLVTRAETAIVDGRFARADSLYEQSFTYADGFPPDLHNAAVTALYLGKSERKG